MVSFNCELLAALIRMINNSIVRLSYSLQKTTKNKNLLSTDKKVKVHCIIQKAMRMFISHGQKD